MNGVPMRWAVAAVLAAVPFAANATSYDLAQEAAQRVAVQIENGDWQGAEQLLSETRRRCEDGPAGKSCRLLIDFNQGYLMQSWAAAEAGDGFERLRRSAAAYERVLEGAPGHPDTINNLTFVLRALKDRDRLRDLMARVRDQSPRQAAAVAAAIGNLHLNDGRAVAALEAYNDALALDPDRETARIRIVSLVPDLPPDRLADLAVLFRTWEARYPTLAADGYRALVRHNGRPDDPTTETGMLRWVAVTASQGLVSGEAADAFHKETDFAPAGELANVLDLPRTIDLPLDVPYQTLRDYAEDWRTGGDIGWWSERQPRRHAIAQAMLALGRRSLVARDLGLAHRQWLFGIKHAPPMDWYVYGDDRQNEFPTFDLHMELVSLMLRNRDITDAWQKHEFFIRGLFREKTEAYRANDLDAIHRLHVILGEIFFGTRRWSGEWRADNAFFQLERAISTGAQLDSRDGTFRPLASLKEKLARAYEEVDRKEDARTTFFDAAEAYLNSDQTERAGEMLQRAPTAGQSGEDAARRAALGEVIEVRTAIEKGLRSALDPAAKATLGGVEDTWLRAASVEGLSADFLIRQQFKAGVDLARLEEKKGDVALASGRASQAIADAKLLPGLVGTSDVLRLNSAVQIATETPPSEKSVLLVSEGEANLTAAATTWQVNISSSATPLVATIPRLEAVPASQGDILLVPFGVNSTTIQAADQDRLKRLVQDLQSDPSRTTVTLTGRTDSTGSADYNKRLAQRRADKVARKLMEYGLPQDQIRVFGVGEERLKVATPDETDEAGNRVVEIRVNRLR